MNPSEGVREIEKEMIYQRRDDDCFRACVANLLGVAYESLSDEPDINLPTDEWLQGWRKVLNIRGFDILFFSYRVNDEWQPKGFSIGVGISPRGKDHAVICLDGKPYFDPYQNSTGFPESFSSYGLITFMDLRNTLTQAEKRGFERAREEALNIANMIPLDENFIPAGNYSANGMNCLVRVIRKGIVENIRNLTYEKKGTKNAKTN